MDEVIVSFNPTEGEVEIVVGNELIRFHPSSLPVVIDKLNGARDALTQLQELAR